MVFSRKACLALAVVTASIASSSNTVYGYRGGIRGLTSTTPNIHSRDLQKDDKDSGGGGNSGSAGGGDGEGANTGGKGGDEGEGEGATTGGKGDGGGKGGGPGGGKGIPVSGRVEAAPLPGVVVLSDREQQEAVCRGHMTAVIRCTRLSGSPALDCFSCIYGYSTTPSSPNANLCGGMCNAPTGHCNEEMTTLLGCLRGDEEEEARLELPSPDADAVATQPAPDDVDGDVDVDIMPESATQPAPDGADADVDVDIMPESGVDDSDVSIVDYASLTTSMGCPPNVEDVYMGVSCEGFIPAPFLYHNCVYAERICTCRTDAPRYLCQDVVEGGVLSPPQPPLNQGGKPKPEGDAAKPDVPKSKPEGPVEVDAPTDNEEAKEKPEQDGPAKKVEKPTDEAVEGKEQKPEGPAKEVDAPIDNEEDEEKPKPEPKPDGSVEEVEEKPEPEGTDEEVPKPEGSTEEVETQTTDEAVEGKPKPEPTPDGPAEEVETPTDKEEVEEKQKPEGPAEEVDAPTDTEEDEEKPKREPKPEESAEEMEKEKPEPTQEGPAEEMETPTDNEEDDKKPKPDGPAEEAETPTDNEEVEEKKPKPEGPVSSNEKGVEDVTTTTTVVEKDIVTTAMEIGSFTTLVTALQASTAELYTTTGDHADPYTVFAPTDEAFALLPTPLVPCLLLPENQAVLTTLVTYHVAVGNVLLYELTNTPHLTTVQGENVNITVVPTIVAAAAGEDTATTTTITLEINNQALVIEPNIVATNGVIHVIDAVLVPPSLDVTAFLTTCPELDEEDVVTAPVEEVEGEPDEDEDVVMVESTSSCGDTAPTNKSPCNTPGLRCGPFSAVVGETAARADATATQYPQCTCKVDRWVCGPFVGGTNNIGGEEVMSDGDGEAVDSLPETTVTDPSIVGASSSSSSSSSSSIEESEDPSIPATPLSVVIASTATATSTICGDTAPTNGSGCENPGVRCGPFTAVVGETRAADATAIQYPQCTCQLDRWVCGPFVRGSK